MPVPLNIAASLALGAALVRVTRRSQALRGAFCSWQLLLLLACEALLVTPTSTAHFCLHCHHALLYALDPQLYPRLEAWSTALAAAAVALNFGAAVAGYAAARHGVLRDQPRWIAAPLATAAALAASTACLAAPRLARLGDYDAFWAGKAPWLLARPAGWAALCTYAAMAGLVGWTARRFGAQDPDFL